jgi:bifunctional DNA-binding transcriptional regulator/antitoxin component of YhaV-PrlF toxin-antitoxin module
VTYLFLAMGEVKHRRRRGHTRICSKHQATLPVDALRQAGLKAGDDLIVEVAGPGRIVLVRADDPVERHAGMAPGVYQPGYLDAGRLTLAGTSERPVARWQ